MPGLAAPALPLLPPAAPGMSGGLLQKTLLGAICQTQLHELRSSPPLGSFYSSAKMGLNVSGFLKEKFEKVCLGVLQFPQHQSDSSNTVWLIIALTICLSLLIEATCCKQCTVKQRL